MFGRLRDHPAAVVEALAPGAPADLVEIARTQDAGLLAVVLAEAREQDRADRHIDAHAERVGAADDLEQALLRELLDQHAVLGQQPGMVKGDAVLEPLADLRAVGAGKLETLNRTPDGILLLAGAHVDAGEVLGALGGFELGEVDDIDGSLALRHQAFERGGQRQLGVGIVQRHRPVLGSDGDRWAPVQTCERLLEEGGVAERGGHQEVARLRQRQQRYLPGDAAVAVGVVVELVHDHLLDVGLRPFA